MTKESNLTKIEDLLNEIYSDGADPTEMAEFLVDNGMGDIEKAHGEGYIEGETDGYQQAQEQTIISRKEMEALDTCLSVFESYNDDPQEMEHAHRAVLKIRIIYQHSLEQAQSS